MRKFNFLSTEDWEGDDGKRMYQKCYEEVVRLGEEERGATQEVLANIGPLLFTAARC